MKRFKNLPLKLHVWIAALFATLIITMPQGLTTALVTGRGDALIIGLAFWIMSVIGAGIVIIILLLIAWFIKTLYLKVRKPKNK